MTTGKGYGIYPDLSSFFIPGKQGRLFASLLTAGGEGRHPLVIMLHGIPGNEKNIDFAQSLRQTRNDARMLTIHPGWTHGLP